MKQFECPYLDECGLCDQTNEDCRIKELFEDFYKVEKLYIEAKAKYEPLKAEIWDLNSTVITWKEQYKKLKDQNHKLKQCLYEIEESFCKEYSGSKYIEEAHIAYWANQILQKIKEVKGDE